MKDRHPVRRRGLPLAPALFPPAAGVLLAGCATMGVALGSVGIPFEAVLRILLAPLVDTGDLPPEWQLIVWELRLPRVVLAALVGAGLSVSGALYQSLLRNPLAEPFLLGVSGGAGAAAAATMVLGVGLWSGSHVVPLAAFIGALGASGVIVLLARHRGRMPVADLVLAGVALGTFLSSVTAFMLLRAGGTAGVFEILAWLMGSLALSSWDRVSLVAPYVLVPMIGTFLVARVLNLLLLGEEQAGHLGLPVEPVKLLLLGLGAVLAAGSVAAAGIIGFVGLVVPHTVRLVAGPDNRRLLPLAALLGAAFLIACDLIARTLVAPTEIPVGIVTALFGAPFFLLLLRRRRLGSLP